MRDLYSLISKMDSIQNEDMDIDRLSLDIDGDVIED